MSKKYVIEIEADVKGEKEVKQLTESTEKLKEGFDTLSESQKEHIVVTEEQSVRMEALGQALGDAFTSMRKWSAAQLDAAKDTTVGIGAIKMFVGRLFGISPLIIGITASIILYRKALKAANVFLASNIEAQDKMIKQQTAVTAWASVWKDVSIWFGEFFHSFRDFFSFASDIANKGLLRLLGLEEYVDEAAKVIEVQQRLNTEWERTANIIQQLGYDSEDYQKIINDETKTQEERFVAAGKWNLAQQDILKLQRERIEDEIFLNKESKEQNDETRNALYKLEGQLSANDRALGELNKTHADTIKKIIDSKIATDELTEAKKNLLKEEANHKAYLEYLAASAEYHKKIELEELARVALRESIEASLVEDLKDELKAKEALAKFDGAMEEDFSFEEEDEIPENPVIKEYHDKKEAGELYQEFLDQNLQDLGGMWGAYFTHLKDLYDTDEKFSEMSSKNKLTIIAGTAQATLGMASQLISQLGAAASDDFETQKKFQIAGATVSTLQGAISAFMSAQTLPQPYGAILGAVLAASTLAMGFANIQKIKSTQPDSAPASGDIGSISAAPSAAPSFSLINPLTQGENQLSNSLSIGTEPTKAYVVSEDMSSQQSLDRRITNQASL